MIYTDTIWKKPSEITIKHRVYQFHGFCLNEIGQLFFIQIHRTITVPRGKLSSGSLFLIFTTKALYPDKFPLSGNFSSRFLYNTGHQREPDLSAIRWPNMTDKV